MQIRALSSADHVAALALWEASGLTRPWNDAGADLRRALQGPESTVLGGYLDGAGLVATAMVGHDGHRGWVYYLAVDPAHRRRGFGRHMMAACEDWVHRHGIPKIQLMVRRDNAEALGFYEGLGYEVSDVTVLGRRLRLGEQVPATESGQGQHPEGEREGTQPDERGPGECVGR